MSFKKAERSLTNLTIAVTGPAGSGKTMSSMFLASGIAKKMGGRFAVIDTENGSASLYSDLFDFDVLNISPPFTTEKYIDAINLAEKGGYKAVVCDSITHAWAGEGGLLEQKDHLDSRPGSNKWTNWNPIKAKDLKFKSSFLQSTIPFFIATMRSKMEYAQTEEGGKKKIQKMGMAPVQADGIEYEFSIVMDLAMNHESEVSKDRTGLFSKMPFFKMTEEIGQLLVKWRSEGKTSPSDIQKETQDTRKALIAANEGLKTKEPPKQEYKEHYVNQDMISDRNWTPTFDNAPRPEGVTGAHILESQASKPAPNSAPQPPKGVDAPAKSHYPVFQFGQFKGKAINEVPVKEVKSYVEFLKSKNFNFQDQRNKGFFDHVAEYIGDTSFLGKVDPVVWCWNCAESFVSSLTECPACGANELDRPATQDITVDDIPF